MGPTTKLALLIGLLLPTTALAGDHVVLVQESNGFPGAEQDSQLAKQTVTVQHGKMEVIDAAHDWILWIDLDGKSVREGIPSRKEYVERSFSHYDKYRQDRKKSLADQAKEFVKFRDRTLDGTKKRALVDRYTRMGGDPAQPGKLVAKLQHYPGDAKKITIYVDSEEREVTLEHWVIRENQAARPVFDMWVTKDVTLPVDMLRFYRELGTFSQQVTRKLLEVEGMIVACEVVLDTGTFKKAFKTAISDVRTTEPPKRQLGPPAGWTKVDPNAKVAQAPAGPEATCPICGKSVPTDAEHTFREPWGARRVYKTCSAEHRRQLIKKLAQARKKKNAQKSP